MVDASSLSLVRIEIEVACDSGQPCFPFFFNPNFGVSNQYFLVAIPPFCR